MASFNKKLKILMAEREITQNELAKATNIPKSSISGWIAGKFTPGKKSVEKLEKYFGIEFDKFEQSTEFLSTKSTTNLKRATIQEAAQRTGKSTLFIRTALIKGACPFGYAVLMESGKYDFHISPKKLDEYSYKQEA